MLPVDENGEALSNAALYGVDARATTEIEELTAAIGAKRILERCGNALTSQSVGPKILWLKKNRPEIFAKAAKIVTSTTYLVQKLTGECVIDHYSAANFSPLYVVDKQDWSNELAPDIIALERLPKLLWSTDIAGHVTSEGRARDRTGRGHAGDRRHHRRGLGSAQRRRGAGRRHDGDVRLDHLHHHAVEGAASRTPGCGMRRGCFRASTRRWRGCRPAAR